MAGDVEFLDDDGAPASADEDLVELGRDRSSRWTLALVVVACVAFAVVAIADKVHREHPAAQPPPGAATSVAPPSGVFTPYVGPALSIGPTAAVDVAVSGNRLYVLQVGRLAELDLHTKQMIAHATVGDFADGPTLRLVSDPADSRIWVITLGLNPTLLTEFDARTLHRLRSVTWGGTVHSATVLDGALYLQTDGVAVLGPNDRAAHDVPALAKDTGTIAADPLRHRLLVMRFGHPSHVVTYSPGGPAVQVSTALDVTSADLAVVDGHVWLGGSGPAGAELEQLDPVTFTPGPNNPLYDFLGPGAVLVARGQHVIWVRPAGGQMSSALSCIVATDGREGRSWFGIGGQVASGGGAGFIADGTAVVPLQMGNCPG